MKKINYFKVRIDGIEIPSSYFINGSCFERLDDAINYLESCWLEFNKSNFLSRFGRRIVNEFISSDSSRYLRQLTVVDKDSFATIVVLSVDCYFLKLK